MNAKLFMVGAASAFLFISSNGAAQQSFLSSPATATAQGSDFLTLPELRARYGKNGDRYLDIDGRAIRYRDEGSGRVVVLLHGSFGSLESYEALAARLAKRYRVLRFDMPGMGLSDALPRSVPVSAPFADDIAALLLDRLKIDRATLIGVSSGGATAFHFAARHPDRVEALILSNTPADPVVKSNIQRSPALAAEFREADRTGVKRLDYWRVYLEWLAGDPARMTPATVRKYHDYNRRVRDADARPFQRPDAIEPTRQALASIAAPTLLVWGAKDPVLPLPAMAVLQSYMTGAQISRIVMPDVGHYPPLEVPARFGAIVETYLTDVLTAR